MIGMRNRSSWLLACLTLVAASAQAQSVGDASARQHRRAAIVDGAAARRHRARDPDQIKTEAGDRLVPRQKLTEIFETVKLKNVIPPIHFESGVAKIPDNYVETLRKALEGLRDHRNVRLHLVGHADNQTLVADARQNFRGQRVGFRASAPARWRNSSSARCN